MHQSHGRSASTDQDDPDALTFLILIFTYQHAQDCSFFHGGIFNTEGGRCHRTLAYQTHAKYQTHHFKR